MLGLWGQEGKTQTWTPFRSLASYQCLFLNRTHCRAMMGRNVKVPMNTYIAPHFQRRRLLSTGRHYHLVPVTAPAKRGECLRNPPGARLPRRVFLGRLGLLCFLASVGSLHPREGHKSVLSFTLLDIRSSESPVSWHFRVDSLRPAGLSGQCWHTGRTPRPLVLSRDVNTVWGPTCTGSMTAYLENLPSSKALRQPPPT